MGSNKKANRWRENEQQKTSSETRIDQTGYQQQNQRDCRHWERFVNYTIDQEKRDPSAQLCGFVSKTGGLCQKSLISSLGWWLPAAAAVSFLSKHLKIYLTLISRQGNNERWIGDSPASIAIVRSFLSEFQMKSNRFGPFIWIWHILDILQQINCHRTLLAYFHQ
jgi:hypothetical protein